MFSLCKLSLLEKKTEIKTTNTKNITQIKAKFKYLFYKHKNRRKKLY